MMVRDQVSAVPPEAWRKATDVSSLSPEQKSALQHVTGGSGRLAVVEGWAGAGKSYLFSAARKVWEQHGFRVVGGALSGKAAASLAHSAGLSDSRTLASWEYVWGRGEARLGHKDILVIDEASLVGTRQMGRVLQEAERGGAKVVLVGDTRQLQAIEAGSPMRALGQVAGRANLRDIRRQSAPWQRQASAALASGRVGEALSAYGKSVHHHDSSETVPAAIAAAWVVQERNSTGSDGTIQVALSHRRRDVAALNMAIRAARREAGLLAPAAADVAIESSQGRRAMAVGDRVCFLRNDRRLGVYNGMTGTVQSASARSLVVRVDGGQLLVVPLSRYRDIEYGYALTIHKAQGQTVDHVYAWATPGMDRHAAYVAMTRHRQSLSMYAARTHFSTHGRLEACLSRSRPKGMAMSFVAAETERRGRQRTANERRDAADASLLTRRNALVQACAAAHSETVRLRALCAQQVLSAAEEVTRSAAYVEGKRYLRGIESQVEAWERLRREAEAQHPMWARLGRVEHVRVTSPETGRKVRLGEGLEAASQRHVQAKEALAMISRSPVLLTEAEERARSAYRSQSLAEAALPVAAHRAQEAKSALMALDHAHPDLAKLHVLSQRSHTFEVAELQARSRQARLEICCQHLMQKQEEVERRSDALRAGRLVPTLDSYSNGRPRLSVHVARQKSWSMHRYERAVKLLQDQTRGVQARLAKALRRLNQVHKRARSLSRDMGR